MDGRKTQREALAHLGDGELLHRWREGQTFAGDVLVERYAKGLYRYFRRRVEGEDTIGELMQDTFTSACEARDRLAEQAAFGPYLYGIARHKLLRHYRMQRLATTILPAREAAAGSGEVYDGRRKLAAMLFALKLLPTGAQRAIALYYWEGARLSEVAALLGVMPAAAKLRVHRARLLLAKKMQSIPPWALRMESLTASFDRWCRSVLPPLG